MSDEHSGAPLRPAPWAGEPAGSRPPGGGPAEVGGPVAVAPFTVAFAAGVTVTKWTRIWEERHPDVPLVVFRSEPGEQTAVLGDARADVSFARLPIDSAGFSVIALYTEVPVVGVWKDHPVSVFESVTVADLADEHLLQDPDEVPEWRDVAREIADGSRRELRGIRNLEDAVEQVAGGVGIVIVPHAIARMHGRKDVVFRLVTDVAETQISLAWLQGSTSPQVAEFIGIVRGRSATSSRAASAARASGAAGADGEKPAKKLGPVAKAKAKARAAAEADAAAAKSSKRGSAGGGRGSGGEGGRAGGTGGATGSAGAKKPGARPVKKKQSDEANAAQARRRKFGGKR
ncbi:hypothetical protein BH09ACT6_BH09ACT6_12440 [soil metagenome]